MTLKDFIQTSRLKPWDFLIILFLILASFTPLLLFGWQKLPANVEMQAILRVDGQEITSFQLLEGKKGFTYLYEAEDGDSNLIEIDGRRIRIKDASCGDQICVRRGWASKNGETIVCLPHKLVIEIKALDGGEHNDLIY